MTSGSEKGSVAATPAPAFNRVFTLLAAALILAFFARVLTESQIKSPVADEPPHIASGLSYVSTGIFRGNPQHPPLLKELSGLSMRLDGIQWPDNPDTRHFLFGSLAPGEQPDWSIGRDLIIANGPDRVLFWARLPLILIATMLAALIYFWGRALIGDLAALCALLLFTCDPNIVAHSYTVTMDVGVTAFSVLFLCTLWRYIQNPTLVRLAICGLALGAALCAKFSAVLLLPVLATLLIAAIRWPSALASSRARTPLDPFYLEPAAPPKAPTLTGRAQGAKSAMQTARQNTPVSPFDLGRLKRCAAVLLIMCAVAAIFTEIVYFLPRDPLAYLHGLMLVNADHNPNYRFYLAGSLVSHTSVYFAVAMLLKEPLASLIVAAVGLFFLIRSRKISKLAKFFLLVPSLLFFVTTSLLADDIGIRYVIPVLPFLHLIGGLGLATLIAMSAKWAKLAAAALMLWAVVAGAGIYPDDLSYFNESACLLAEPSRLGFDGGSKCGTYWLDDSNVDWGSSLKQLKQWVDQNAKGRTLLLDYPWSFPASAYGITSTPEDFPFQTPPGPGLHAVSATVVSRYPAGDGGSDWLRRTIPNAIVGHSIYIYDVKPLR